jgi:hypothetical protein
VVRKWIRRYKEMGEEGLKDYSRAPKESPSRIFPEEFACLPPVILDDVSTFWAVKGGNDLLAPYTVLSGSFPKFYAKS